MARQTSIEVYKQVEAEGLLSRLRLEVYKVVCEHGPLTAGEIADLHLPKYQQQSVSPRLSELEVRNAVSRVGERPCRMTGRVSYLWSSTCSLPSKPPKKKPKKLTAEEENEACAKLIEELTKDAILAYAIRKRYHDAV